MSTDFAPLFEKKFHDKVVPGNCFNIFFFVKSNYLFTFFILPGLLHLMDDNANPRVQAHAGAALVNFSEGLFTFFFVKPIAIYLFTFFSCNQLFVYIFIPLFF